MSTAGKVLVVLSVLMLAVWIVMISAVAQLNSNATQKLDTLAKSIIQLQADVIAAEQSANDLRGKINDEQVSKERDLRLVRIRLSTAERQLSTTKETLARVSIQVDNYTKSLATAREGLELRGQEKADLEKKKADEEALVTRLKGENDELLGQLTKLRTDFQETLKKNSGEVEGLRKGGNPTRSASLAAPALR